MRFSADPKLILRSPVHFLAFGFGAGLSSKAPGTMGTLVAVPLVSALLLLPLTAYLCCVLIVCIVGVYICGRSANELGVHDHPGIVWDEIAGFAITMIALPNNWMFLLAGFVLFRLFDIFKPWPIREADHRLSGGVGIMLDDVIAGLFSCVLLHVAAARFT